MALQDQQAFSRFESGNKSWLRRLSAKTNGEYRYGDIVNEAWITAAAMESKGIEVDFDCPIFQDLLRAYLWQRLGKFAETHVRCSLRLDHSLDGDSDDQPHPLSRALAAEENYEPDTAFFLRELQESEQLALDSESSLAKAYLQILEHFHYQITHMAEYLLISESAARRGFAKAIQIAKWQRSFRWDNEKQLPFPRPWRLRRGCGPSATRA